MRIKNVSTMLRALAKKDPPMRPHLVWIVFLIAAAPLRAEDWPQWRGPRRDGSWNGAALPARLPEGGFPLVWRKPIAPGYSGLAVAAGRVYTMDRPTPAKGKDGTSPADASLPAESERVVCLDETTGRKI